MKHHGIKSALIIGAAPEEDVCYIKRLAEDKNADLIICADGGMDTAARAGITPDLIIGDFDSAKSGAEVFAEVERVVLPAEKDDTDMRVCVDAALSRGARIVYMAGVCGGRADHHIANLHLLEYIHDRGARGEIHDPRNMIGFHDGGKREFDRDDKYKYFSILPVDLVITNVTLDGFKYPMKNGFAERSTPITVSNEFIADRARMSFDGRAFYIFAAEK